MFLHLAQYLQSQGIEVEWLSNLTPTLNKTQLHNHITELRNKYAHHV